MPRPAPLPVRKPLPEPVAPSPWEIEPRLPSQPALPAEPQPWSRPSWEELPEPIRYPERVVWPEVVIEGRLVSGQPRLRVRGRSREDGLPTRERDEKPGRRGGLWALHSFITNVWGEMSEMFDLWEILQANLYTKQGTRLSAIRGKLDPAKVMRAWVAGDLELDVMGFLQDYAINQLQDEVIGRLSSSGGR